MKVLGDLYQLDSFITVEEVLVEKGEVKGLIDDFNFEVA